MPTIKALQPDSTLLRITSSSALSSHSTHDIKLTESLPLGERTQPYLTRNQEDINEPVSMSCSEGDVLGSMVYEDHDALAALHWDPEI
jgi:hypothetical protein